MGFQSLYRRYRSQRFSEIRGQQQVTGALRAAVAEGRHSHAYLFSGPRGTGKTSTARVLAKALNCDNLDDGEPCGECASCLSIEKGTSFDLHELDAASNNKVDDIRELIAKVALGSPGRTKVYILDEVHMLTAGAENALLKTLEEPPEHVVFVLATTEPHKVVETIRSRTQHFEFKLLPGSELDDHLRFVIDDAGLEVDEAGIAYALRQGGGSARDTLSALELVASAGGVPEGSDIGHQLALAIGQADPATTISTVQQALERGREPRTIGELTIEALRNAFLVSMDTAVPHLSDAAQVQSSELASTLTPATITRSLETLGTALVEMRQAPDPRVPLEVALLRLARRDATDVAALMQRIEQLEVTIAGLAAGAVAVPAPPEGDDEDEAASVNAPHPPPFEEVVTPQPPAQAAGPAPASAAREVLDKRPAPPPNNRRAQPSPPPRQTQPEQVAPQSAPAPEPAPEPEPEPQAAPRPAAGNGSNVTLDQLNLAFGPILEDLPQKVRARFRYGQFSRVEDGVATFAVPSEHVIPRCEEVRDEVEAAIASRVGPITINVVVDGDQKPPSSPGQSSQPATASSTATAPAPAPPDPEPEEEIHMADLTDATDVGNSSVERLTQAFPGSEVIEASD